MSLRTRHLKEKVTIALCALGTLVAAGLLFLILGYIFIGALPSLSLQFLLTPENETYLGGGIANAIVGTILLSLLSTILAVPCAIGTAIYLKRYAKESRLTHFIRFMIEVLAGTPSVVVGIFGLLVLVIYLQKVTGGFSLIAGIICLAILVIPVIERAMESAIDTVNPELEEGSYALGATKWQTLKMTTLPAAVNGIMTGIILGFGRAAEESSVVVLTAGYSQFLPAFGISHSSKFLSGLQIHPFNDVIGSLPDAVYIAYESSNVIPMSNAYAIAFVLITFVLLVNIAAKIVCSRAIGSSQGSKSDFTQSVCALIMDPFRKKKQKDQPSYGDEEMTSLISPVELSGREDVLNPETRTIEPLPNRNEEDDAKTTVPVPPVVESSHPTRTKIKILLAGTGISGIFKAIRQVGHTLVHGNREKKTPVNTATAIGSVAHPATVRRSLPVNLWSTLGSVRSFIVTLAPFALVTVILIALTVMLPAMSPVGSNGPAGSLTVPIMTLIICVVGVVCALFLVRNSTLFLLRRQKGRMGNRGAEFAAIATGFCLVIFGAFLFSAHIFSPIPSTPSLVSEASTGTGIFGYFTPSGNGVFSQVSGLVLNNSLFSFLYKPGNATTSNAMDTSNRSARMAAFLASEETPTEVPLQSTPIALQPSSAPSSASQVSSPGSTVPVKNALDVGESYWYGDNSRPCLATIYNATTMPLYFYWDVDWNRFVQVTPASNGDTFLVIFIRIEDTGNMSAIVPPAAQYVVYYKGQGYYNEPYFDTSVLDANEISIYTANFNLLPYQWIREIGQQKRDYAFLTGYNIFGQNTTVISNYSANNQFTPPTANTPNGEGHFIKPGRSNAIDGYLIYEVPGGVATDLKDTYVQVPFNSFSSTQWRLGK